MKILFLVAKKDIQVEERVVELHSRQGLDQEMRKLQEDYYIIKWRKA